MLWRPLVNLYLTRPWWRHRDFPLFLSVWVGTTAWLLSVTMTLEDLGFTLVILPLNTLGCLSSWGLFLLSEERPREQIEHWLSTSIYLRAILFALVIMPGFAGVPPFTLLFPEVAVGSSEFMTGILFSWGHVLYSFTMIQPGLLMMSAVPGFSMFGLMTTMNVNPSLMVVFLIFILSYLYGLSHITFWREMPHAQGSVVARRWPHWRPRVVSDHFLVSSALLTSLTLVTLALTPLLLRISPRLVPMSAFINQLQEEMYQTGDNYAGFLDEFRVGTGPVSLSDRPVMNVRTDRDEGPFLLRGSVYDSYTGNGWKQSLPGRTQIAGEGGRFVIESTRQQVDGWAERPEIAQEIETLRPMPGIVFGRAEPVGLYTPRAERPVFVNDYGCLTSQLNLRRGSRYIVTSAVPLYPEDRLNQAAGPLPAAVRELYLDLPMGVDELRQLTLQITAEAPTPHQKAVRIKQYLETRCVYGDAPRTPWGRDAATYFVMESRKGVCDLFATSMAVMARAAGIPARVATGFLVQQLSPGNQGYLVREKDAHAWTELYFAGHGWVSFDAQGPAAETPTEELRAWLNQGRGLRPTLKKIAFWALLIGLAGWLLSHTHRSWVMPQWQAWRLWRVQQSTPRGQIIDSYLTMQRLLHRRGHPRPAAETPLEFLDRIAREQRPDWLAACAALTALFYRARYGPHQVSEQQAEEARDWLRRVRDGLRAKGRAAREEAGGSRG